MPTDTNGWTAQHGVLVSSRRQPNARPQGLPLPFAARRGIDFDWLLIRLVATAIIAGAVASVLLGLVAICGAAWLLITVVREIMRAVSGG